MHLSGLQSHFFQTSGVRFLGGGRAVVIDNLIDCHDQSVSPFPSYHVCSEQIGQAMTCESWILIFSRKQIVNAWQHHQHDVLPFKHDF